MGVAPIIYQGDRDWERFPGFGDGGATGSGGPRELGYPVVEIFVRGIWTSITDRVRWSEGIEIRRGRDSEASEVDFTSCRMTLDNRDGLFSVRNPLSPYFGHLKLNTPVRVGVVRNGVTWWRFTGEASEWPVTWDRSAKEENADRDVTVNLQASGILRRLTQNSEPLKSAMFRNITRIDADQDTVVGYWPLEEPSGAVDFSSPLLNVSNATILGVGPTAQGFTGWLGSDGGITMNAGSVGFLCPAYTPNTSQFVRFLMHAPDTAVGSTQTVCRVTTTGTARYFTIQVDASFNLRLLVQDADEAVLYNSGFLDFGAIEGRQSAILLKLTTNGSDIDVTFIVANVETPFSWAPADLPENIISPTISSQTAGYVYRTQIGNNFGIDGWSFAQVVVVNDSELFGEITSGNVTALLAYAGENPSDRMRRLCAEEGISIDVVSKGQLGNTVAMGAQGVKPFIELIQECAQTDAGILFEPRGQVAIGYRSRLSLYNQDPALVLDYSNSDPADVPVPVDDDRHIVNDVFANNESGQTAPSNFRATQTSGDRNVNDPAVDENGIGRYQGTVNVSITVDETNGINSDNATATLADQAGWSLHLGTWDEERYPSVAVDLHRQELTSSVEKTNAVLALDQGDRFDIDNMPSWATPNSVSQILQGYTEFIGGSTLHSITFNGTPARPWNVAFMESTDVARLDTGGSHLVSAVDGDDTTLTVEVEDGTGWALSAVDPADFPFDVTIGGEIVTVNSITAGATDQFVFSVTRSVNGIVKAQEAGTNVRLAAPAIIQL